MAGPARTYDHIYVEPWWNEHTYFCIFRVRVRSYCCILYFQSTKLNMPHVSMCPIGRRISGRPGERYEGGRVGGGEGLGVVGRLLCGGSCACLACCYRTLYQAPGISYIARYTYTSTRTSSFFRVVPHRTDVFGDENYLQSTPRGRWNSSNATHIQADRTIAVTWQCWHALCVPGACHRQRPLLRAGADSSGSSVPGGALLATVAATTPCGVPINSTR